MNKSLKQLGIKWEFEIPSKGNSTPIQLRSYNLYQKRLSDYELDDIRFMIGQEIGPQYLVRMAIEHLKDDILLDAEYYEGDLLNIVLKLPPSFWESNQELALDFVKLINENNDKIENLDLSLDVEREIYQSSNEFMDKFSF